MALTATATQTLFSVDANSFTTGSSSPTSGALYVVFTVGRTGGTTYRTPTLAGTGGWFTTWNRVMAAQAICGFAGVNASGTDCFWGVASSGVAGTLTFDYGAGTNLRSGTIHVLLIDGGPSLSAPIGKTASANDNSAGSATISTGLLGTPAATSIVVATASSDVGSGTVTPSSGYTLLGTAQIPDAGISQPEYDEAPTSATVGATFVSADIMTISAVEILVPGVSPVRSEPQASTSANEAAISRNLTEMIGMGGHYRA